MEDAVGSAVTLQRKLNSRLCVAGKVVMKLGKVEEVESRRKHSKKIL